MAWIAAGATGVLYFLGFTGFGYWPLIFIFQVPLYVAVEGKERLVGPWTALGLGQVAGTVAYMGGYYWVVHLLRLFAKLDLPWALLGFLLLVIYKGGTLTVEAWLYQRMRTRGWSPSLCGAVAMVSVESVYPLLFPNYAANALFRVPLFTQPVELFGMAALGVLLGGVNGALAGAVVAARRHRGGVRLALRTAAPALVLVAVYAGYGLLRIPMVRAQFEDVDTMKVAMVQANLGAEEDQVSRAEQARQHQRMTREVFEAHPDLDLVVWPESGFGQALSRDNVNLAAVSGFVPVQLLFGVTTVDLSQRPRRAYNSALLTSIAGRRVGRFDKIELLMFGETIPFVDSIPWIKEWFPQSGRFTAGTDYQNLVTDDGVRMLPMICYEDIIPEFVRTMWRKAGPADVLVNLTNDSWYGDTHEPTTHLALATFRTIETRRYMIRSTNTGISAIVDPVGQIVARTGQRTKETLLYDVPVLQTGASTLYMRHGNVLGWLGVLVAVWGARPRRGRPGRH